MLLPRKLSQVLPFPAELRVMSWNILADQLANTFPLVPACFLAWNYRKTLIQAEVERFDPDILMVQELDHFQDFTEMLGSDEYQGEFFQKGTWHKDGLAIFVRRSAFEILQVFRVPLNESQRALGMMLRTKEAPRRDFLVFNTHLKSSTGFDLQRAQQVKKIALFIHGISQLPLVLAGDFNCQPASLPYTEIENSGLNVKSVYSRYFLGGEPQFTSVKVREKLEFKTDDYIWQRGFEVVEVLEIPELQDVGNVGLPGKNYPSDHFALATSLRFTNKG